MCVSFIFFFFAYSAIAMIEISHAASRTFFPVSYFLRRIEQEIQGIFSDISTACDLVAERWCMSRNCNKTN